MPNRGDWLPEDIATSLAGADAVTCPADGASVVLGDAGTVIVSDPGDGELASGVRSSTHFRLPGPLPVDVAVRFYGHSPTSPHWRWGQAEDRRPIHVLVKLPEGCLYLGTARPSGGASGLRFAQELPTELLDLVRPSLSDVELPGLGWLADVAADPLRALDGFVGEWLPQTREDPGEPPAGPFPMPEPLAVYYRLTRHRPALLGVQNRLLTPDRWCADSAGRIEFGHENQGCFSWLFDPADADPVVWIDRDDAGLQREQERLSGFLLQFALFETMMNASYTACAAVLTPEQAARVTTAFTALPLRPWRWPGPTRFHVAPGMVATVTTSCEGDASVWVGALHPAALFPLAELGVTWDGFDG